MHKVSIVSCKDYDQADEAVQIALQKANITLPKRGKILIKPNLLAQNTPDQHTITNYKLIAAICKLLKNCKIYIGDSAAFYQTGYTWGAFKTSKIEEVAKEYGAELIAFEDEPMQEVRKLKFLKKLYLPKIIKDFDLIINVPKLKTHALMRFSGAVKNFYGIVSGGYKQYLHLSSNSINEFAQVVLDVYQNLPKSISIMDAVYGLDGGPAAITGTPKNLGYILASKDPFALDSVACKLIGYSWQDITTLTQAKKRKLFDPKNVKEIGDYETTEFKHLQKGPIEYHNPHTLSIDETHAWPCATLDCKKCGKCVNYCPVHAASLGENKAEFDLKKCIFCYTCVPQCPSKAIKLKSSFIGNVIQVGRRIIGS